MGTVKSGWLQKLSGFFKNTWKKRYFVLYQSGDFCYYQDPHDKELDGKISMKTECRKIAVGHQVEEGVKAPKDIDALFCVVSTERTFYLVADSAGEAREWVVALEQARAPVPFASNIATGPPQPQYAPAPYGYGTPGAPVGPPPAYSQAAPAPYPLANPASAYPPQAQPYPPRPPYAQPPPQYPQQPGPYPPQGYPPQPYPQQPPPGAYRPPPAQYPQQQHHPGAAGYAHGAQPQTVYVQSQGHHSKSGTNKMLMGAGAGALGGAAMGYMLGRASGGYGGGYGHGYGHGGWDSDHSWSSGGSFDCDFD